MIAILAGSGANAAMSTTPANGSLSFFKVLVGKSSTASFTINNTSTIQALPPPQGGGALTCISSRFRHFSPSTTAMFDLAAPSGFTVTATNRYTYLLPPNVVANWGGGSTVSRVYTFTPTAPGTFNMAMTFSPSTGFPSPEPSSIVTFSGTGVAPVISLTTSAAAAGNIQIGTTGTASITIIPHAAISETVSNRWKLRVIREARSIACLVGRAAIVSSMAIRKSANVG